MGIIKLYENLDLEKQISNTQMYTVKDFLNFFNIPVQDISKLLDFSEEMIEDKKFILKHKKQFRSLTEREVEVFKLVVEGKKSNEIAESLFIETVTVSVHRKHIIHKLNLQSSYDWYKYAKVFGVLNL